MAASQLLCHAFVFSSSSAVQDEEKETVITSLSNPFVKHCVKLRLSSSYRHSNSTALVVGFTPISEILRFEEKNRTSVNIDRSDSLVECLMLLDEMEVPMPYFRSGKDACWKVVRVSREVMRKVSGLKSVDSTETIAVLRIPRSFLSLEGAESMDYLNRFGGKPHRILVLDGIQDPGNLGNLLRSAMAFKWDGVFLLPGCCDPFNEKAVRAARGSSFQMPIVRGNWVHLKSFRDHFKMKMLAGHPENDEQKLYNHRQFSIHLADVLSDKDICLVLGSEGQGISEQTKLMCELVSIPMAGDFESLNVSVAGGILLFLLQAGI